ncbi:MAG: TRAP transporter substrate-binding protein DctP [Spirochaetota bacterium]
MHAKRFIAHLFFLLTVAAALAQAPLLCRVSVENGVSHFQTRAVKQFADLLAAKSQGALRVEFHDSASLYRDADAVGALATGKVEIIVPGIWQLDRFVPETAALMLPSVYAQPRSIMKNLVDGPFGHSLSKSISSVLGAVVIGPWLDLGYGQVFGASKPIRSIAEIAGKRIRVAGGKGNEERIRELGAEAVSISMLDLPSYLEKGMLDGILSTYETIDSAALDRAGIRTVLEDTEYYPFYVPLAGGQFWARLSPGLKDMVLGSWKEIIARVRDESVRAQEVAKRNLEYRGLVVYQPTEAERSGTRKKLLEAEDAMARRLNVSAAIVSLLRSEIAKLEKE